MSDRVLTEPITRAFRSIPADSEEVPQARLNIENRSRTNLFAWNGQFSPQFVEALLERYATRDSVVLDPFAGSGTTIYESARRGIEAYGLELNPSAYFMAKLYEVCQEEQTWRERVIETVNGIVNSCLYDANAIEVLANRYISEQQDAIRNTLALLIVLLDIYNKETTPRLLFEKWDRLRGTIRQLPTTDKRVGMHLGDARHIPLAADSVNLVITSPPYINVFNYHQNYRRSVEALGFDVLDIAKRELGSNRKHRGNRLFTVVQYCIDMALALNDLSRVCTQDARMILVVGRESNVLGYSFLNSELVFDICEEILGFRLLLRQERVFKNRYGQMIYEDILHFENTKSVGDDISEQTLTELARCVARKALEDKLGSDHGSKNRSLLVAAVENLNNINKSEDD